MSAGFLSSEQAASFLLNYDKSLAVSPQMESVHINPHSPVHQSVIGDTSGFFFSSVVQPNSSKRCPLVRTRVRARLTGERGGD